MNFDPFGDFETRGYLRNIDQQKDRQIIKAQEHLFFESNLEDALDFLSPQNSPELTYDSFLRVHKILFGMFYPWAGSDRFALGVARHVGQGAGIVEFEESGRSEQAVQWGLNMAADPRVMRAKPGTIMGAFAWGHPFLDGNGRTMLLIHTELCARAGFAIDWTLSPKNAYLEALTNELWTPDKGVLDSYFAPLICPLETRLGWRDRILSIQGLDGAHATEQNIAYESDDPAGETRYKEMRDARRKSL